MRAEYAVAFAISGVVTFAVTPLVRRLALNRGLLVAPGDRSVHERPIANIGGAAMFAGVLVGLLVAWLSGGLVDVFQSPSAPLGVAAAATVIFLVGLLDDVR
jgi:UDP-GlcNAc:undecaprenyl-phosphate GlcNAc-1-phosphate transferase